MRQMGENSNHLLVFVSYLQAAKWAFEEHLLRKNYEEARNYALLCLNAYRKYKVGLANHAECNFNL